MPSRFVAPKRVETLEDVRKALQLVQEQFDANGISRARQALVTKDTTLRAGEFVRLSPRQGQTLYAKLPKATAENIGLRIEVSIERPNGTVKISAEKPDTVSGLATASFTLAGLIILESNGTDQWVLFNQLPTNSPGAATNYFFSNANGVTFGTTGSTVTASVAPSANDQIGQVAIPLVTQNSVSQLVFQNTPSVTWSGSAGTANRLILAAHVASTQASIRFDMGSVSVLASRLSFSSPTNTIQLAFNTALTGNVEFFGTGSSVSARAAIRVSAGTTAYNGTVFSFNNANRVTFGMDTNFVSVPIITASIPAAIFRVHAGGSSFSDGTALSFDNSGGAVSFGLSVVGSVNIITASHNGLTAGPLALMGILEAGAGNITGGTVSFSRRGDSSPTDIRGGAMGVNCQLSNSTFLFDYDPPRFVGRWNAITGTVQFALTAFHNRPFFFQPFVGDPLEHFGRGNDGDIGIWKIGHTASVSTNASATMSVGSRVTYMIGLYSLEGGTGSRLSLVNSASLGVSRGANSASVMSAWHGSRWVEFPQTNWSNDGALSAGNWWIALMVSNILGTNATATATSLTSSPLLNFMGAGLLNTTYGFGNVGNNAIAPNNRIHPFHGFYTTTTAAFPATIASSHVFTTASAPFSPNGWIPAVSLEVVHNAAFG